MRYTIFLTLLCTFCATFSFAEKQEYNFDDTKSLILKVSDTGLTRLSVQGDRLREVIGLDDAVNVEKDEANGHLFLKSVKKKQTITIVTEGGALQDLTLIPTTKGSTTILLKNETHNTKNDTKQVQLSSGNLHHPSINITGSTRGSDAILYVIRQLCAGEGVSCDHNDSRKTTEGLEAVPTHQLYLQTFVGNVYVITNTHDTQMTLCEKDFYQTGDLALAVSKHELSPGETATLYVVRNG